MTDFAGLLQSPRRARVEFIVAGGSAGTLHGSSLPTRDFDVVDSREPGSIERLVEPLGSHDP